MVDFNRPPYFDDYDPLKDFYKILFRPGIAVQTRELTQLQSILQNQIAKFGASIFEEGSKILGGETVVDVNYHYLKMTSVNKSFAYIKDLVDNDAYRVVATNPLTGVVANVVNIVDVEGSDPLTIYVKYVTSGNDGETKTFAASDALVFTLYDQVTGETVLDLPSTNAIQFSGTVASGTTAVGLGSAVQVSEGVRFIRGFFARVAKQTVIISKYSNKPTAVVGLKIIESIVTPEMDRSLLDNATGSENENAPGAHRFRIILELRQATRAEQDFIVLVELLDGKLQQKLADVRITDTIVGKELAGRLKDQSGDFIVNPFLLVPREHLNDGTNGGRFTALDGGDEAKFVVEIENGRAYVDGFLIQQVKQDVVEINKSRDRKSQGNTAISDTYGSYFLTRTDYNFTGSPLPFKEVNLVGSFTLEKEIIATGDPTETITFKTEEFPVISLGTTVATGTDDLIVTVNGDEVDASLNQTTGVLTITSPSPAYGVGEELEVVIQSKHCVLGTANFLTYGVSSIANTVRMYVCDVSLKYGTTNNLTGYEKDTSGTGVTIVGAGVPSRLRGYFGDATQFNPSTISVFFGASKALAVREFSFDNIAVITDLSYTVNRTFEVTGNDSLVGATISLGSDETFASSDVIVVGLTTNADDFATATGTVVSAGTGLEIPGTAIPTNGGTQKYLVTAKVSVNVANSPRKYSLATPTETYTVPSLVDLNNRATPYVIQLNRGFGVELISVKLVVGGTDVTSAFRFDSGQRDGCIKKASIKLIAGNENLVAGQAIRVTYSHYQQGASGAYAAGGDDTISDATYPIYKDIPEYTSQFSSSLVQLRDAMDFRPRLDGYANAGGEHGDVLAPDISIRADIEYYLARKDKLFVKPNGEYFVKTGVPAVIPTAPNDDVNGMLLAIISVPAFTIRAEDVTLGIVDHKRFTMRDIAGMEKRLTNLEYYSTLSQLEKNTSERKYLDDGDLDRFKNGFIVDDFSNQSVANATDPEFSAATDLIQGEVRPAYTIRPLTLSIKSMNGLQQTGDLITLPYTEIELIKQIQGTRPMNVNPYDVFSWDGEISLTPSSDFWVDTETRPAVVTEEDQFTSVRDALHAAKALGTIWDAWQDIWRGRPVIESRKRRRRRHVWLNQAITLTTVTAQEVGQTRKGIENVVISSTENKSLGERIVSTGVIPYIRSRDIEFTGQRLKPNTRVFAFFDGINVSSYCTPTGGLLGDSLMTDAEGNVSGIFSIPNTDAVRFRTGSRTFRLVDDASNRENFSTTIAETQYSAEGTVETKQETILSVRKAIVRSRPINEARSITERTTTTNTVSTWCRWSDPLAQSFLIQQTGGVFVTSLDLYFSSKPRGAQGVLPPVTVELRQMNNGIPTQVSIPFGTATLRADDVNTSEDGSVSTTFTFPSPVYLMEGGEYAFVVMANSNEYAVFVSEMGGFDTVTGARVDKQPYAGTLFKSQNNSTWTPEQTQDMKFILKTAQFDTTSRVLDTEIIHDELAELIDSPLEFLGQKDSDLTKAIIRVHHEAHGMRAGSEVTLSDVEPSSGTTLFGLEIVKLNTTHEIIDGTYTVDSVTYDSYTENTYLIEIDIETDTISGQGTFSGGDAVKATYDIRANIVHPIFGEMTIPGTSLDWAVQTIVRDNDGTYTQDSVLGILTGDNTAFYDAERVIPSEVNLEQVSGSPSALEMFCSFSSNNPNISPVLDTERMGLMVIGNVIEETGGKGYITKTISLNDPAITLKTIVDASIPPDGEIEVYYRALRTGQSDISTSEWIRMVETKTAAKTLDPDEFDEFEYSTGTLEDDNVEEFNAFQVKIVMLTDSTARVPKITSFRTIALGT